MPDTNPADLNRSAARRRGERDDGKVMGGYVRDAEEARRTAPTPPVYEGPTVDMGGAVGAAEAARGEGAASTPTEAPEAPEAEAPAKPSKATKATAKAAKANSKTSKATARSASTRN